MVDSAKKSAQRWNHSLFCCVVIHRLMWIKLYTIRASVWKSQKNVAFWHFHSLLIIVSKSANIS